MSNRIDSNLTFSVGVVNSEISPDVNVGVDVAADLGMSQIEIEDFWGRAAFECDDTLVDRTRAAVDRAGLNVSAVGTQAFKVLILPPGDVGELASIDGWDQHRIELEGGIRVAQALGSPFVRIFSCRRDDMVGMGNPSPRLPDGGPVPADRLAGIAAVLRDAGDRAEAAGITLLVENVRSCWGNTAVNTVRILEATDHPRVKLNWDPSNDFVSGGNPFPPGYAIAQPWTEHVHIKDASVVDHSTGLIAWECVGRGEVDFVGQLRALIDDGFAGAVNLETHWHPEHRSKEANSRESFAGMLEALQLAQRAGA
ncbi:MAG: sugar phosphate isomerase/epimerase [Chloroflexota bacterium]|nr:sugar phosphate isomerase/epimerase [Chloroflexota bacterium]MDE2918643.1 sugar phosphate isomerase/epimerase [Chloroflexota bacterium]